MKISDMSWKQNEILVRVLNQLLLLHYEQLYLPNVQITVIWVQEVFCLWKIEELKEGSESQVAVELFWCSVSNVISYSSWLLQAGKGCIEQVLWKKKNAVDSDLNRLTRSVDSHIEFPNDMSHCRIRVDMNGACYKKNHHSSSLMFSL